MTDDADLDRPDQALIIDYATAVSAASGVILDIDQAEAWQVQALDMSGTLLESIDLGPNLLLDGSATPWVFDRNLSDIQQIRIEYTGTTNGNVGLAFDNFSPSSAILFVPEPSSTVLFIASAMAAVVCRRKRLA